MQPTEITKLEGRLSFVQKRVHMLQHQIDGLVNLKSGAEQNELLVSWDQPPLSPQRIQELDDWNAHRPAELDAEMQRLLDEQAELTQRLR